MKCFINKFRRLEYVFVMMYILFSCNTNIKLPKLSFEKTEFDFEFIKHKIPVEAFFRFQNSGEGDLLITDIRTSCGCTTPVWPKEKIKSGKSGEIKVIFDAERLGRFDKTITVYYYNNKEKKAETLRIKGFVKYPEAK